MYTYEVLRETWIYKEIQQEIRQEERQGKLTEQRQTLLAIVHGRFPRVESLAAHIVEHMTEPDTLRKLMIRISTARTEKEARQLLHEEQTL